MGNKTLIRRAMNKKYAPLNTQQASSVSKGTRRRDFMKSAGASIAGLVLSSTFFKSEFGNAFALAGADDGLEEAARSFIANTYPQAVKVSEDLLGKWSDPSNICGPLAFAIAADMRLQPNHSIHQGPKRYIEGIDYRDMWLASPKGSSIGSDLIPRVLFPGDQFDLFHINQNIGQLDFNSIPGAMQLIPGDILFLEGGSFTHWLTVSRRDIDGNLYASSNLPGINPKEYIISEIQLWNPTQKDGYFRNLARGVGPEKASTGKSGFYLWRRKQPLEAYLPGTAADEFRDILLNTMLKQQKGEWEILIHEFGKGLLYEWQDRRIYHPASTIKLLVGVALLQVLYKQFGQNIASEGLETFLAQHGWEGRTFDQLISAMLVKSEEDATESCVRYISTKSSLADQFKELGLQNTSYLPRKSSQRELFSVWNGLFTGLLLDPAGRNYLLRKLSEYTPNDDIMIGSLRKKKYPDAIQWNKRGEVMGGGLFTMQDTGVLKIGNRYFYIGFAGTSTSQHPASDSELVRFIEDQLCGPFANFIQKTS